PPRCLGVGSGSALAAAALAVVSPDLFFASFVLADPLAYPLVLTPLYAAVCALSRPSRRAQVAFIVLAGLTAMTRVQYALLPIVFVVGALAVERGSIRSALRSFRLTWGVFAAPVAALVMLGPSRVLGYYNSVIDLHVQPGAIAHWIATDSMLLVSRSPRWRSPVSVLPHGSRSHRIASATTNRTRRSCSASSGSSTPSEPRMDPSRSQSRPRSCRYLQFGSPGEPGSRCSHCLSRS